MNWLMIAFTAALFYALVPGVFVRLPPGCSKMVVTATHAVIFALVLHFTRQIAQSYLGREGVDETLKKKKKAYDQDREREREREHVNKD